MAHHNMVFARLLKSVFRRESEALVGKYRERQKLRKMTDWSPFAALGFAQLAGRSSLRDIISNLAAQTTKLYHLSSSQVTRRSLPRTNETQPYTPYEVLFHRLLSRRQGLAPRYCFLLKNKLYSRDPSSIDLCLSVFPYAKFRTTKSVVKLHISVDHDEFSPAFVTATDGKTYDLNVGLTLVLPADTIAVMDRTFIDCGWFTALDDNGVLFVARQKRNVRYRVIERRTVLRAKALVSEQTIPIIGAVNYPIPLRRVGNQDPDHGKEYHFLINNCNLTANTIADIYKARWQTELFCKCISQNFKIKSFVGTSKNALLMQISAAMYTYLSLTWIKYNRPVDGNLQK